MTEPSPGQAGEALVVVVDDEHMIVEEIVEHLCFTGIAARATFSARGALELVGRLPSLRVLVTDLRMPATDGLDLLRKLKADRGPQLGGLRVIVLTGHATPADEQAARTAGAWDFLRKPCSLVELRCAIVAALDGAPAEAVAGPSCPRDAQQEGRS